ncbi:MAG: ribosome maturation factor RimM [Ruminococcus sp.]|jgi:16S rRNA processing protein RimM|nr:ribosome maturation factor RimM [Ruminococcus sp.]
MEKFLEAGKIVSTFGIKGEIIAECYCDSPQLLCEFETLFFDKGKKTLEIESSFPRKSNAVLKISGIETVEAARLLIGKVLYLDREDLILGENEYFYADLIGLTAIDFETNEKIGEIIDVTNNGAHENYLIKCENGEFLIPAVPEFIKETDINAGIIKIVLIDGLREV